MNQDRPNQNATRLLLKLFLFAALGFIAIGYTAIFADPNSSLWFSVVVGFLLLVNPPSIFAMTSKPLVGPLPGWLVISMLGLFDFVSFFLGTSRILWVIAPLSLMIPLYVTSRVIRVIFNLDLEAAVD